MYFQLLNEFGMQQHVAPDQCFDIVVLQGACSSKSEKKGFVAGVTFFSRCVFCFGFFFVFAVFFLPRVFSDFFLNLGPHQKQPTP
jgi:hypothetical protein